MTNTCPYCKRTLRYPDKCHICGAALTTPRRTRIESEPRLNPRAHVLYHSPEWERLVESGWYTAWVFVNPNDGAHIAVMSKER